MFCDPLDFQQFTTVRWLGCFMPLSLKLVCRPAGRRSTVITLVAQLLNVN
jgi:hypothetical protein